MQYHDGTLVKLGDRVRAAVPAGTAPARIVMLGDTYEHLEIDPQFLSWVKRDRVLEAGHVVLEWIEENPFAHEDPKCAPVGNYMFSPLDSAVTRDV
jgi:hypothetical protein